MKAIFGAMDSMACERIAQSVDVRNQILQSIYN